MKYLMRGLINAELSTTNEFTCTVGRQFSTQEHWCQILFQPEIHKYSLIDLIMDCFRNVQPFTFELLIFLSRRYNLGWKWPFLRITALLRSNIILHCWTKSLCIILDHSDSSYNYYSLGDMFFNSHDNMMVLTVH